MILAPILGDYCSVIGRRNTIVYGFVIVSLATVGFAMASLFEDNKVFYTVSIVARSLQGAADAMILVAIPSIIAVEWPDK